MKAKKWILNHIYPDQGEQVVSFCEYSGRDASSLAPHVRYFLYDLQKSSFTGKTSFDKIHQQVAWRHQALHPNESEVPPERVQRFLFDFLRGVQDAYDKEPCVPVIGILLSDKALTQNDETASHINIHHEKRGEVTQIYLTTGWIAQHCGTPKEELSPFRTESVSTNYAYDAGYEEQQHNSDLTIRKILKKAETIPHSYEENAKTGTYFSPKMAHAILTAEGTEIEFQGATGIGLYEKSGLIVPGLHYTKDAAELSAGLVCLDRQINALLAQNNEQPSAAADTEKVLSKVSHLQETGILSKTENLPYNDPMAAMDNKFNAMMAQKQKAETRKKSL